jgi:hypothetical protein
MLAIRPADEQLGSPLPNADAFACRTISNSFGGLLALTYRCGALLLTGCGADVKLPSNLQSGMPPY